ncbi:hypothetical protein ACH3VR_12555 [Microbacterium sp. B2969]|uniref:Uncharacterized protein n=1 Tax=Microbacterium alkaliflavum TaxID=3248839 RepID=A0ABW7QA08_9MICO
MTIPVFASSPAYRVAVAELPLATRTADRAAGAVVVLEGRAGWWDAATAAIEDGAVAIVATEPVAPPVEVLEALRRVPVIVDRARLREDVVADVRRAAVVPRVLSALSQAPACTHALRDAVGWLRVLAGGPLRVGGSRRPGDPALLEPADGDGPLAALTSVEGPGMPDLMRVTAVAERRVEVEASRTRIVVSLADGAGVLIQPSRFESASRLALRRAIAALDDGGEPADLADLIHDATLARALAASRGA